MGKLGGRGEKNLGERKKNSGIEQRKILKDNLKFFKYYRFHGMFFMIRIFW